MAQTLQTKTSPAVTAVGRLIGAHATLTRELSARLVAEHGLTLSDYEVLLLLSRAPERKMRRIDLAGQVKLSPSGVTRMLDRMEKAALVEKGPCASDARVTYAVLTDAGAEKLLECAPAHFAAAERLLGERLDEGELASLVELLGRLSDASGEECEPGTPS
jgi:DNA-binding MarR family transcriptional regulator